MFLTPIARAFAAGAAFLLVATAVAVPLSVAAPAEPAAAAVPPSPLAAFTADTCPGDTLEDPRDRTGAVHPEQGSSVVPDLTYVWGPRLDAFNAGGVVVLYDVFGTNTGDDAYPAVCGVRYDPDAPGGHVSEWMFCTDYFSKVCAATDVDGYLHADLSRAAIPQPAALPGNPKLDADQEHLIGYLIRHGAPFNVDGAVSGFDAGGVLEARVDKGTDERVALQLLVWCVSDWPDPGNVLPEHVVSETNRLQMCEDSMSLTEQARLLALIPPTPVVELDLLQPARSSARPGETLVFQLETNVYDAPITITATGSATLAVTGGTATLNGSELIVDGVDGTASTVITLSVTTTTSGRVDVSATAAPMNTESLSWNQAAVECQVFATFTAKALPQVDDLVTLAFAAPELARSGPADATVVAGVAALAVVVLGVGLVFARRFTPRAATRPTERR